MRILAYGQRISGCTWHRLTLPLGFMPGTKSHLTNLIGQDVIDKGWDILLYNRTSQFDNNWDRFRKETNMKVVMDIDDSWILPPTHVNYSEYRKNQIRIENNIRNADLVTVTHSRLAEMCYPFNRNVEIMPNALPYGLNQYKDDRVPTPDGKVRLFWAGGISHVTDVEILRNPMKRIKTLPDIQAVIGGYSSDNADTKEKWDKMVSAFTCSLRIDPVILPSLPVEKYMDHFQHADIMLVPLEDNAWHSNKSNLKLLEAGSKRIPVLVSKVHPYIDGNPPVMYVERQSGWYVGVKVLLDPELRTAMGNELHKWAVKNFNLFDINKKRYQCFQNLLTHSKDTSTITTG